MKKYRIIFILSIIAFVVFSCTPKWNNMEDIENSSIIHFPYILNGSLSLDDYSIVEAKGNKEQVNDNAVNNYGFTEGYILPTTPEQDNVIRSTFTDISTNEDYSIISNNCATTVQRSLNAVGINTSITRRETDAFISTSPKVYKPWLPSETFRAIRTNNPNGIYIKR